MKIRNGFVSNSSSSSFVIAVKKNATKEDIKNAFYELEKDIVDFLIDTNESLDVPEFIDQLVSEVMSYKNRGVELDSWVVSADMFSDEESYAELGCFIYAYTGGIRKDFLKIVAVD
jgi:hypothetical protein